MAVKFTVYQESKAAFFPWNHVTRMLVILGKSLTQGGRHKEGELSTECHFRPSPFLIPLKYSQALKDKCLSQESAMTNEGPPVPSGATLLRCPLLRGDDVPDRTPVRAGVRWSIRQFLSSVVRGHAARKLSIF